MIKLRIQIPGVASIRKLKTFLNKNKISLFVFGETHGFLNDLELQERIIKSILPGIYIYEMLEDNSITSEIEFRDFISKEDSSQFSIISSFGELKPAIKMAWRNNLKIFGCDLRNMGRADNSFLKTKELTEQEEKRELELLKKREEYQSKKISELIVNKQLSFVSLGAYHLRKDSEIWNLLKKFNPVICYPTLNGKQEFGPTDDLRESKIIYFLDTYDHYSK
jgi:hypothetical protein